MRRFPALKDVKSSPWEVPQRVYPSACVHLFILFQKMSFFALPFYAHFVLLFSSLPSFLFFPLPVSPILSPVNQDPSLQERKGFPRSPVELKEGEQFSNHHLNYCVDEAGGWGRGRKKGLRQFRQFIVRHATRRAAWGSPISPGTETIGRKSERKMYTALIGGLLVISFH